MCFTILRRSAPKYPKSILFRQDYIWVFLKIRVSKSIGFRMKEDTFGIYFCGPAFWKNNWPPFVPPSHTWGCRLEISRRPSNLEICDRRSLAQKSTETWGYHTEIWYTLRVISLTWPNKLWTLPDPSPFCNHSGVDDFCWCSAWKQRNCALPD